MEIFPAIDLKNGEAVRLTQGDYNQVKVYFKNPSEVLEFFKKNNSRYLHIVDLDGAFAGKPKNLAVIHEILQSVGAKIPVQLGGGIRDVQTIESYIALGLSYVILGTAALSDAPFLDAMLKEYGERIAVGGDARDGRVRVASR